MHYSFNPTGNNDVVLTTQLLKQFLRIDNDSEDLKIQSIIDHAVDLFQNRTGYIFRAGKIKLVFSYKDNVRYKKRKRKTYPASYIGDDSGWDDSDFYLLSLGANISTQKPEAFSFFKSGDMEEEVTLSSDQLRDALPANFFIVKRQFPFEFKFPRVLDKLQDLGFNRYYEGNTMKATLNVGAITIPEDLKGAIIRMASAIYESPDIGQSFDDALIQSAFANYNLRVGL